MGMLLDRLTGRKATGPSGTQSYTTRDGESTIDVYFTAYRTITLDVQGSNCGTGPDDEPEQVFVSLQPGEEEAIAAMIARVRASER